jgi:hypothetical protein
MLPFIVRVVLLLVGLAAAGGALFSAFGFCVCIAKLDFRQAKFWFGNAGAAGVVSYLMYLCFAKLEWVLPWIFDDEAIYNSFLPKPLTEAKALALAKRSGEPLAALAPRLLTLSPQAAEIICGQPSRIWLRFERLKRISAEAAAVLAERHQDGMLSLALGELPPAVAVQLARIRSPLFLNSLKEISDEAAVALGRHAGWLTLNGLRRLSAVAATELSRHQPIRQYHLWTNCLGLDGLGQLSEEAAGSLVDFQGELSLGGLKKLPVAVARMLAARTPMKDLIRDASLKIDGLPTVSADAAEAIAAYRGGLSLNGVEVLAPEALRALARHRGGPLFLERLRSMPDTIAFLFAARPDGLVLRNLREISPPALAALQSNPNISLPTELSEPLESKDT